MSLQFVCCKLQSAKIIEEKCVLTLFFHRTLRRLKIYTIYGKNNTNGPSGGHTAMGKSISDPLPHTHTLPPELCW